MSSTIKVDPITLLRESYSNNQSIVLNNNLLVFSNKISLKLDTPTAWKPKDQNKRYSVGDLWLFLESRKNNKPTNEYYLSIAEFRKSTSLQFITIHHQAEVEAYFFGKQQSSNCIDENLRDFILTEKKKSSNSKLPDTRILISDEKIMERVETIFRDSDKEVESALMIMKWEKVTNPYSSKMKLNKDFRFILKMMEEQSSKTKNYENKIEIGGPCTVITRLINNNNKKPIIIVPNERISGNLNLNNVIDFLRDGKFTPAENIEYSESFENSKNNLEVKLEIIPGNEITFEIGSDINEFKRSGRMNSIGAIFLSGSQFQFKDIDKIWNEPTIAKLLKRVRGYLVLYSDMTIHPIVSKWNIKVLKIDRNARHKDLVVIEEFKEDFINFLLNNEQ